MSGGGGHRRSPVPRLSQSGTYRRTAAISSSSLFMRRGAEGWVRLASANKNQGSCENTRLLAARRAFGLRGWRQPSPLWRRTVSHGKLRMIPAFRKPCPATCEPAACTKNRHQSVQMFAMSLHGPMTAFLPPERGGGLWQSALSSWAQFAGKSHEGNCESSGDVWYGF